jgi:hypothetical protein
MNERLSETLINNRPACGIMPSLLTLAIGASALTAVADWAGWHFVWRHESTLGQETPRKHGATSIFMSYYLPFMPTLAILLGPAKLEVYNDGFAHAASFLLILLMAIVTGGVSASAWSRRRGRPQIDRPTRPLAQTRISTSSLDNHYANDLFDLLVLFANLLKRWIDEGAPAPLV